MEAPTSANRLSPAARQQLEAHCTFKRIVELDYIHPFGDGNSRTLRTFTKQLAYESGYDLDWTRFACSEAGRDLLYIARDLSVNELARSHIQHEQGMRKIIHSMDRLEGNRDLFGLLRDAVRPSPTRVNN